MRTPWHIIMEMDMPEFAGQSILEIWERPAGRHKHQWKSYNLESNNRHRPHGYKIKNVYCDVDGCKVAFIKESGPEGKAWW